MQKNVIVKLHSWVGGVFQEIDLVVLPIILRFWIRVYREPLKVKNVKDLKKASEILVRRNMKISKNRPEILMKYC